MINWRRSLTLRLVSLFVLVTTALLVAMATITMLATDQHFLELDEVYLRDKGELVQELGQHAANADDLVAWVSSTLKRQTNLNIELFEDGTRIYRSPGFDLPEHIAGILKHDTPGVVAQWQSNDQQMRGLSMAIALDDQATEATVTAILAVNTDHHDHFMATFGRAIWLYVLLAIVIGSVLGWWATRKGLTPLRPIIDKAQRINASQLSDRIPTQNIPTELQPLTETLNDMLERLENDFTRLSDFSSDLAHELRTPVSNMLVQTQVTLSKTRETNQYQDVLHSMVEELERLSHMVSDMLYLAKTENQLEILNPSIINLHDQSTELTEFYGLMAEEKDVTLKVVGQGQVRGDRLMIRRAISNLLSNAIRHADNHTTVTITIDSHAQKTWLAVTNLGNTIEPKKQIRLFDRFYRAEEARTHPGSDGAGLGLAITKAVMLAHGGSIDLESAEGKTTFTLRFLLTAANR